MIQERTYERGCWIGGIRGQHLADTILLEIAQSYGFTGEYLPSPGDTSDDDIEWANWDDAFGEIVYAAEQFIQTNILKDGDVGGWHEGDFMVMPLEWWEEVD